MTGRPTIIFVECKRPGAKATAGQLREHERLRALGCRVEVVSTPEEVSDLFSEVA